jgi:tRNA A37 threonylcarbamoyladenosine dehydratase
MEENQFSRTEMLLGKSALERLNKAKVAVFGVGGVGGYAVEGLVRSGVGAIDIIDSDRVAISNINRQIIANHSTIRKFKVDVCEERCLEINPNVKISKFTTFYLPETSNLFNFGNYDYIVDAIDTVTGKIELIVNANLSNTPIISSMGAGNKLNPSEFEVEDIYKTSVCPLARTMRYELRKRGFEKFKVVYSKEKPISVNNSENLTNKKRFPGSVAFVPSVVGMIIAGEVVKDLIK